MPVEREIGIAFLAQTAPAILSQLHNTHLAWNIVFIGGLLVTWFLMPHILAL